MESSVNPRYLYDGTSVNLILPSFILALSHLLTLDLLQKAIIFAFFVFIVRTLAAHHR